MKKVIIAAIAALALVGCGSSSSDCLYGCGEIGETSTVTETVTVIEYVEVEGCTEKINIEELENGDLFWEVTSVDADGEKCTGGEGDHNNDRNGTVEIDTITEIVTESCIQTISTETLGNGDIFWETTSEGDCDGVEDTNGTIKHNTIIKEVIIKIPVYVTETCVESIVTEELENGDIAWHTVLTGDGCEGIETKEGLIEHTENEVIKIVELPCECPPSPEVCGDTCDGKITSLTLKNTGPTATIKVEDTDGNVLFDAVVGKGENFTINDGQINPSNQDELPTLGTKIFIYVGDNDPIEIHTSCSEPIYVGMTIESFEVVSGESRNGGPLGADCTAHEEDCEQNT